MRTIERTGQFERDYKREAKGAYREIQEVDFIAVVRTLASDQPLEAKYRDYALTCEWKDYRDCHVRADLVLIYRKPDPDRLQLVRTGSHAQLGF